MDKGRFFWYHQYRRIEIATYRLEDEMTEKEKMLKGMLYFADSDGQLKQERFDAKNLCCDYNLFRPHETKKQRELLEKLCAIMSLSPQERS